MRLIPLLLCLVTSFGCSAHAASERKFPEGMIELSDIHEDELAPAVKKVEELVAAGSKEVMFRINSYGGAVFDGMEFIQAIEEHKKAGVRVICVVDFKAYSMGFAILQAVCDERLITKRSTLLAHKVSSGVKGNADAIEEELQSLRAWDLALAELCADRLKMSTEAYQEKVSRGDWTLAWKEALEVGAVDGVIDPKRLPPVYKLEAAEVNPFRFLFRQ